MGSGLQDPSRQARESPKFELTDNRKGSQSFDSTHPQLTQ